MGNDFSKMEINLRQVAEQESSSFEGVFELPVNKEGLLKADVRVKTVVTSMSNRYLLAADVECDLHGTCSRCLEDCVSKISAEFEIMFQREENVRGFSGPTEGDFVLLSSEEESCYDISPMVKESLLLSIPMKILCAEDCKGLCPICGANLNIEECGCERDETDPRWAPLNELLNDENK